MAGPTPGVGALQDGMRKDAPRGAPQPPSARRGGAPCAGALGAWEERRAVGRDVAERRKERSAL